MNEKVIKDLAEAGAKMAKGYDNLVNVDSVEIGTTPKELVHTVDKVKLYRYVRNTPATIKTPLIISYALVNRYEMMDLQPDRSFIANLLHLGLDVYVIDWGYPTKADRYLTLSDYVNWYINDVVDFVRKSHGFDKVNLLGVCQGGTLSIIYSALYPEKIKNLITTVTPVDFSTNDGLLFRWSRKLNIDRIVDVHRNVPGEFLNNGFGMLKPMMKVNKFNSFPDLLDDKDKMMNFLRMEKWINDSPDQAGECFRQFIKDLYQENKLVKGELEVDGVKVKLKNVTMPVLNIYATEDHLVPPAATIPLNDHIGSKDHELYKFPGGHIGVFVGNRSQKELAPAVAKWLMNRDK
ncbi:MAG: class III poly(R)-hydroxyalkanoic acid synthase subunit PhaC [Bacteroidetes bacterium]|jgi:polyhydroxyalkanoate synthase|nr:class III poly(R)-hydroxyalkanoic acid synthase subunit PhaC [Bacteroidota bacterium]